MVPGGGGGSGIPRVGIREAGKREGEGSWRITAFGVFNNQNAFSSMGWRGRGLLYSACSGNYPAVGSNL